MVGGFPSAGLSGANGKPDSSVSVAKGDCMPCALTNWLRAGSGIRALASGSGGVFARISKGSGVRPSDCVSVGSGVGPAFWSEAGLASGVGVPDPSAPGVPDASGVGVPDPSAPGVPNGSGAGVVVGDGVATWVGLGTGVAVDVTVGVAVRVGVLVGRGVGVGAFTGALGLTG